MKKRFTEEQIIRFTEFAMAVWAHQRGVKLAFTQPGKPAPIVL